MLIAQTGGAYSVARLITVFLLFLFVLGITYLTSRYVAVFQKNHLKTANIEVLEAVRISPTVVFQIVRAGEQYLLVSVAKDRVSVLTELSPEEIVHSEMKPDNFSEVMKKATGKWNAARVLGKGRKSEDKDVTDENE
ncbi:MAG: flagellar biosynthetic protein FliO [Lachnospiraceae bacterium]|nr:flagellar biosynthetic protein FliO [Lachnospiraceae bacterium]